MEQAPAQFGGAVVPARLEAEKLKAATEWLAAYRRFWDQSLDRLDDYLKDIQTRKDDQP